MNYSEKLKAFNLSEKYKKEMGFLLKLVSPKKGERILDYGCGLGTCVKYFKKNSDAEIFGFDVNCHIEGERPNWFLDKLEGGFDKVYFLHSFAHIHNIEEVLSSLKNFLNKNGRIYLITPNKDFDDYFKKNIKEPKYIPDETVFRHYTLKDIRDLFLKFNFKIINQGRLGEAIEGIRERLFLEAGV